MAQKSQPETDRGVADGFKAEDSREVKSAEAEVMSQRPVPKIAVGLILGNDTRSFTNN